MALAPRNRCSADGCRRFFLPSRCISIWSKRRRSVSTTLVVAVFPEVLIYDFEGKIGGTLWGVEIKNGGDSIL